MFCGTSPALPGTDRVSSMRLHPNVNPPAAGRRRTVALLWTLSILAGGVGVAGCETIHGAGQVSSQGGSSAAAGITLPLPGSR